MVTVLDVLRGAAGYMEGKGVENPRLNAEHLLAHVLGRKRLDLYLEFDRPLEETERAPMRELIRARAEGRPLQHLLGTVEFFGRSFLCDARALIPRPETEQFVELALARLEGDVAGVVDVGTGSGVLAITVALERPGTRVVGVDLQAEALSLAAENATRLGAAVEWQLADLWPPGMDRVDAILANLPYIPTAEIGTLSREVQHDPPSALDGGVDGMSLLRKLIASAPERLRANGLLGLEIGAGQSDALVGQLGAHNFRDIQALADYQGHTRFLFAKHG